MVVAGSLMVQFAKNAGGTDASSASAFDSGIVLVMVFISSFSGVANEKSMKVKASCMRWMEIAPFPLTRKIGISDTIATPQSEKKCFCGEKYFAQYF